VIRIVLENELRLPLGDIFAAAYDEYGKNLKAKKPDVIADLLAFFADRLKVHLKEQGVRHDLITAVFALGGEDDLVRLIRRVDALTGFLESEDGANLLTAYKRAANIVRIEEKKDSQSYADALDADALVADEAKTLAGDLTSAETAVEEHLMAEDFSAAMMALAALRRPVDTVFDKVTINAGDTKERAANLGLLARIGQAMDQVADFSKVEG
jgi:glycyl-tRNA synthetase beta chain